MSQKVANFELPETGFPHWKRLKGVAIFPRTQIGSLARALELLIRFTERRPEWSVGDLARDTGLPKGTVSKVLSTFLAAGFVSQDPTRRTYRLGPAILAAGRVAERTTNVVASSVPALERMAHATGETSALMLRSGWRTVLVAKVDSTQPIRMSAEVGRYASLHSGASNKPVLAFMDPEEIEAYLASPLFIRRGPHTITDRRDLLNNLAEIRRTGVSASDAEVEDGVAALGAPVFNGDGKVVGAASVIGPVSRILAASRSALEDAVKEGAREITLLHGWLGAWPPTTDERPGARD